MLSSDGINTPSILPKEKMFKNDKNVLTRTLRNNTVKPVNSNPAK
jgi:hypothetical protein